jgi:3-oxoacyl-[acyl-carrier protein] reductase
MKLENQVAIVTGAGRNIGEDVSKLLARNGATIAVVDLDKARGEKVAADIIAAGGKAQAFVCDVSSEDDIVKCVKDVSDAFGRIDILVNSAGIAGPTATVLDVKMEDWHRTIAINLNGTFFTNRAVVPHMMAGNYGRIVNIASIAGKEGNPNASHYSASKAGVVALTKSLGKELATSGVLVNCITPAVIETDIFAQMTQAHIDYMLSKIPMARFGQKHEAAALVAWLSSEDCSFSTGAVFDLSGGRATY